MRTLLLAGWLLLPVGFGVWHYGPVQERMKLDAVARLLKQADESAKAGEHARAVELYDEALHKYMALLDYKVSTGYDFDQKHEKEDERRVADTYRVISLSFSNLGGPDAVRDYFTMF